MTAKVSLQRSMEDQILNAKLMFEYCDQEILGIEFFYLEKSRVDQTRKNLEERMGLAKTIPGTRGFHQFIPLTQNRIGAKRVSEDKQFALIFSFTTSPADQTLAHNLTPGSFVVSMYDSHHWLGVVSQIDKDNEDVQIKFMHPHFPTHSFEWPSREDICWMPDINVLVVVDTPVPSTRSGRQYHLSTSDMSRIEESLR